MKDNLSNNKPAISSCTPPPKKNKVNKNNHTCSALHSPRTTRTYTGSSDGILGFYIVKYVGLNKLTVLCVD